MTLGYVIENLVDHGQHGPLLAQWHASEWGHLYRADVWNQETAVREFSEMQRDAVPLTLVALSLTTHQVLGSVSVIADDDLDGFAHLTPWVASLFVVPLARGLGIAGALINAALSVATNLGFQQVYLFTAGQEEYYLQRGWDIVAQATAHGHPATVMVRET